MIEMYASPEMSQGLTNFSILYIEYPLLKLKDKWFPPSEKTLNKRVAYYADLYTHGGETAIPLIMDAIKKGASPDQVVDKKDWGGPVTGKEPLIVKAARSGSFFLVQALQSAGAKLDATDSNGDTALIAAARVGSLETTSFLVEFGADITLANKKGDALYVAEEAKQGSVAKYLKQALSRAFKTADTGEQATPATVVPSVAVALKPQAKAS